MADKVGTPLKVTARAVDIKDETVSKRPISNLLPGVNQTDLITKFLAGTGDHLFQPELTEKLDGFIGKITNYSKLDSEFYIGESTKERTEYQLDPVIVSKNVDTSVTEDVLFYEDIVNLLRFQGSLTNNHDRLFNTDYYSWCPPIDLDKLMNFTNYFWFDGSPTIIRITELTDVGILFGLSTPITIQGVTFVDGDRVVFENDINFIYRNRVFVVSGIGTSFALTLDTAASDFVWDDDLGDGWDEEPWDGPNPELAEKATDPDYVVIEAGARNGNKWSRRNLWFHVDDLTDSGLVPDLQKQAKRPIIEFNKDLELFNHGTFGRSPVTVKDDATTNPDTQIVGQTTVIFIDGIGLSDGDTILFTGLPSLTGSWGVTNWDSDEWDPTGTLVTEYQDRVFLVDGVGTPGGITLTLVIDGQSADGSPTEGDHIKVISGVANQGKEYYWNNTSWILAQEKAALHQAPFFQLYDSEGVKLQDTGKYLLSNFINGSRLFGYKINTDPRQVDDAVLGFPATFNAFGEYVFENYLVSERYTFNAPLEDIIGFYFHQIIGDTSANNVFGNDWHLSALPSRQFLSNIFTSDGVIKTFTLSVVPDDTGEVEVFANGVKQTTVTWTFDGADITFLTVFVKDTVIRIRYYSSLNLEENDTAVYEIPINLEGNPDNIEVLETSNSEFFNHFTTIIENQVSFLGNPNGKNNWRGTSKNKSLGEKVFQHQAPMMKLMALGSREDIDLMNSVQFSEREFTRMRNKFIGKINEFFQDTTHTTSQAASVWVEDALDAITLGKVNTFPFAQSGMGVRVNGEPTYIPPSPARLGVGQVFEPHLYLDSTYTPSRNVLQFHDGSLLIAYNDFRDDVILDLETNIYNSIPAEYKTEELPDFDWTDFVDAKFRTDNDYTLSEFNTLLIPIIERWAIKNSLDTAVNSTYNVSDPFTFNYSAQGLPGYWRGIFKFYYDTDRPGTHAWEMFGFSEEPAWWSDRYGNAPYTSTNNLLWSDVRTGNIADGVRAGINLKYARPDVVIPVDVNGKVIDPITLNLATEPTINEAKANWAIGDHAPVETVFRRSSVWSYALAQISYLMKPVRFVELGWEPKTTVFRYATQTDKQLVNTDTEDRKTTGELFVHNELQTGTSLKYLSNGISQWISDYLTTNGKDIKTNFGNIIRTLEPQLGHKMAGFILEDGTTVLADNFDLVPSEDITIQVYSNRSTKEESYSAVIIEKVETGWSVSGYDILNPVFKTLPSIKTGPKSDIEVSGILVFEYKFFDETSIDVSYNSVFATRQDVYDFLISHGRYLESRGWIFDDFDIENNFTNNWRKAGKDFLFWSLGNWTEGALISVSPSAKKVKFKSVQGAVQNVEQLINGLYSLLDRDGRIIQPRETFVSRIGSDVEIIPNENQAIYAARLFVSETEHVMTFKNLTIFNDLIYDPLYKLRQPRFRLSTSRAGLWTGRIDAPGYTVSGDTLIPNFEKTANDFRRYFEIEDVVERPALQENAKKLIGFRTRDYMSDLVLNNVTQFQFYQGFIKEKGTRLVLDKLLRSDITVQEDDVKFFEEWALRLGEFGSVNDETLVELLIRTDEYKSNPQLIEFKGSVLQDLLSATATSLVLEDASGFPTTGTLTIEDEQITYTGKSSNTLTGLTRGVKGTTATFHTIATLVGLFDTSDDDILLISNNDDRWIMRPPNNGRAIFPFRDNSITTRGKNGVYFVKSDHPIGGYPLDSEVTHHVDTIADRDAIFDTQKATTEAVDLIFGDLIWVDDIKNFYASADENEQFNFEFMVYRYTDSGLTFTLPKLPLNPGDKTLIKTFADHGFFDGEIIMIDNNTGTTIPDITGSYDATLVTSELGATFGSVLVGSVVVVNGVNISFSGSTITEIIADINLVNVSNILTFEDNGKIQFINIEGEDIILDDLDSGTTLANMGFVADTFKRTTVANSGPNFFSIDINVTSITHGWSENPLGWSNFPWSSVQPGTLGLFTESRFTTTTARDAATINAELGVMDNVWDEGNLVFVDTGITIDSVNRWVVYTRVGSAWVTAQNDETDRIQSRRIDAELFNETLLYNNSTNLLDGKLDLWDPAKGFFPGQSLDEINYKIEYDPAKYTKGDTTLFQIDLLQAWGQEQVGQVWWDLSTVEYLDYENGSNRERRNKWGRLNTGASIDVYEWVRSPVPPLDWEQHVLDNLAKPKESFDYKPSGEAHQKDATNPPYVQEIVRNQITGDEEMVYYFWVKNSSSLPNVLFRNLTVFQIANQMLNPTNEGLLWFAAINEHELIISGVQPFLTQNNSVLQINYNVTRNENSTHREWILTRDGDARDVPIDRFWNKMRDSLAGFDVNFDIVPDPALQLSRKYGNFIRPRQSWFIDRAEAGKIFIDAVNTQLINVCVVDDRTNLFDNLNNKSAEPILRTQSTGWSGELSGWSDFPWSSRPSTLVCEYDFHVATNEARDALTGLTVGDLVWVDGIPETAGFWKVYEYDGTTFTEFCSEAYRVSDFWTLVDFFAVGFNEDTVLDLTVDTIAERDAITDPVIGLLVRVEDSNNDGSNVWGWFEYDPVTDEFNPWKLVAKEDCSIQFTISLFFDAAYGNLDLTTNIEGRDLALEEVITALRNDISTNEEENLLFFKMINYVHAEQTLVDWAFKTTYLIALGFNQSASQEPILRKDTRENFIEYINEAKPYHTKLRDFISNHDFAIDVIQNNMTDFDKPIDSILGVLDPDNPTHAAIMADVTSAQNDWFLNHALNPELIRTFNTTIKFDRVSCDLSSGWDPVDGWDFSTNENWDLTNIDVNQTAIDRINAYYIAKPFTQAEVDNNTAGSIKDFTTLISGCDFSGTIFDGDQFNLVDINNLDTFLDGGVLSDSGTLSSSDIIVDGNLFIQPGFDSNHPEERVFSNIGENISIKTTTKENIGTPHVITKKYNGIGVGPYQLGQQVASKDAVFVYINGVRSKIEDFTIDMDKDTFIFTAGVGSSLTGADIIIVTSFSIYGAEVISTTNEFDGNGSVAIFILDEDPATDDSVFVTNNGVVQVLGVDYTISLDQLIFSITPIVGDDIVATIFASNKFTQVLTSQLIASIPTTLPAFNTYAIGQDVIASVITEEDHLIVTVNGIRQKSKKLAATYSWSDSEWSASPWSAVANFATPYDYKVDFATDEVIFAVSSESKPTPSYITGQTIIINSVSVTLTGTTVKDVIDDINNEGITNIIATFGSGAETSIVVINDIGEDITFAEGTGDALDDIGFPVGSVGSKLNLGDVIIISSIKNDHFRIIHEYTGVVDTFDLFQDIVVQEQVTVNVNGSPLILSGEYTVDTIANTVTLLPGSVSIGDTIEILVDYASTDRFPGNSGGPGGKAQYVASQAIDDPQKTFVSVNGTRQRFGSEYVIDGGHITFSNSHNIADEVMITVLTGRDSAVPITWRSVLTNLDASNASVIEHQADTTLTTSITSLDFSLTVDSVAGFSPSGTLLIGTATNNIMVWEFIEYSGIASNTLTLTVRGSQGSTVAPHSTGDTIVVLDPNLPQIATWQSHRISDASKANLARPLLIDDTEIHLNKIAGLPKQTSGQIRLTVPGVIWINDERIEFYERDGVILKQIIRGTKGTSSGIPSVYDSDGLVSDHVINNGTLTYPIGTTVIDGSKKQEIPGDYEWEPNGFGLQYANTVLANFLKDKPGTC